MPTAFKTPDNEKSFSGLIDAAVLATGKPASLISIVSAANAVIRECQALGLFARDLIEDSVVTPGTQSGPYIWTRPNPQFRSLRTVKYVGVCTRYPKFLPPGKQQRNECDYFYAADDYYVFSGVGANETIAFAMYYWSQRLPYYALLGVSTANFPGGPYDTRPAYYDSEAGKWQYLNNTNDGYVDTTGDPNVDLARQQLASNWLVSEWFDLILAGTKAKIFTSTGDPRAGATYSDYKQQQAVLKNTVGYEAEGF